MIMNILFLTIIKINDVDERGIYTDLIRKFRDEGHKVFIVSPTERRFKEKTALVKNMGVTLLKVKTLNIQKTNVVEKGMAILFLEYQFYKQIKRFFSDVKFDLVLYSTPPITFTKIVKAIKIKDNSKSYLLLKDIFPQNAVDLGLMKENGLLHRFFRRKEKLMYAVSDYIGCLSPANVTYVLKHNPQISPEIVEVCPNTIQPLSSELQVKHPELIHEKYQIPINATIFVYGGNLGKPQGLDFLPQVLESNNNKQDRFFIIVGSGTEQKKLAEWFKLYKPTNAVLLENMKKEDYDNLVQSCDVGLIFLDKLFSIPNYPSRLLSYLEYGMPVIIASDNNTDLGEIAVQNNYGFFTINGNLNEFNQHINRLVGEKNLINKMGNNGFRFLLENYTVDNSFRIIMNHFSSYV